MTSPILQPFRALRAAPAWAAQVAARPYDVLSEAEARGGANGRPRSFLHVSRAEVDFAEGTDPYSDAVYTRAAENLREMLAAGTLIRDDRPHYYVYRMTQDGHVQTGIAAAASVAAYESNRIRKHEHTRPDKEQDRARQIAAVGAHTGPVLLAHPADAIIGDILVATARGNPDAEAVTDDGVLHQLWVVSDGTALATLGQRFEAMPAIYIADGHHRSAAGARVARARGGSDPRFLVVSFPADEMRILDYNRVVRDLNGLGEEQFLAKLAEIFEVTAVAGVARPDRRGTFGLVLASGWYRLALREPPSATLSPVARLDVSLLADRLLTPILGIGDPRTDKRIDFVGGGRGLNELERRVKTGEAAVAFALYPTALEDLMAVADAGLVMPPKSTWFEPKLADGLVSLPL